VAAGVDYQNRDDTSHLHPFYLATNIMSHYGYQGEDTKIISYTTQKANKNIIFLAAYTLNDNNVPELWCYDRKYCDIK